MGKCHGRCPCNTANNMKRLFNIVVMLSLTIATAMAQSPAKGIKVKVSTSAGADLLVDGKASSTNIMSTQLTPGTHQVTVKYGNSFTKTYDINIAEGGQTSFDFPIEGTLQISCKQPANIMVDGINRGKAPQQLNILGTHNIKIEGDFATYFDESDHVTVNPFESVTRNYNLKKRPPRTYGMVMANYTPNGYGGMLAIVKRWGIYMRVTQSDPGSFNEESTSKRYTTSGDKGIGIYKKDSHTYLMACAGVMLRMNKWLYLYGGSGYGKYSQVMKLDRPESSSLNESRQPYGSKGVAADVGAILKWKALLVSAGFSTVFGDNNGVALKEFNIGVGFTIHKNKKR